MNAGRGVRTFAFATAGLLIVATLFQLVDQLNLIYQPPAIPEGANLVDRVLALIPYRQQDWPIFLGANLFAGLGFLAVVGLALALAGQVGRSDDRRNLLLWTLASAGLVGLVGQLVLLGAVNASIAIPYCDCGFKNEEIVSQVWAEMVVQSAVQWLIWGASLLAAGGLVISGRLFAGRTMSLAWGWWSYLTAALLVVTVVLAYASVGGDLSTWLTLAATGIAVPAWAIWLGLRFSAVPIE
ncbi:MAG TPA: hypothetical protein VKR30_02640 [Candidatus Limnocylindrales bacterium]|nr:hypothetical protein [Candidatus Limnocylindrales bacterium]